MANLSSGGARAYTLQDVIGILNDNITQANSPQDNDTEIDNSLATAQEDCRVSDVGAATTHTAATIATYNNGTYGAGVYA